MSELPPASCAVCGKKQGLLLCSACRVIHYCCSDHQIKHRPGHKAACTAIKKAKQLVETEETRLRKTEPGLCSSIPPLFQALTLIDTKESLQAQLDDLHRLFLLGPHHVPFARYYLPALMIRLGKDQECYDLLKWFRAVIDIPDEDWATETRLGVTVKEADPFQPDRFSIGGQSELDVKIHQVLMKVRVLLDVGALDNLFGAVGTRLPRDILVKIKAYLLRTSIVAGNSDIFEADNHKANRTELANTLQTQLSILMMMVYAENPHYWPTLTSPRALNYRNGRLQMHSFIDKSWEIDSPEVAEAIVKVTIDVWLSTPGALDVVRNEWDSIQRTLPPIGSFRNPLQGSCPAM